MNMLAYILYLLLTYVITVHVGLVFYRNGRVFILSLLHKDLALTQFINRVLLVGYYLFNMGYAALMLQTWTPVSTWTELLSGIAVMIGKIMLTLAIVHFCNMGAIYLLSKRHHDILNAKV